MNRFSRCHSVLSRAVRWSALAAGLALSAAASAQPERYSTTPTGWWYMTGGSASAVHARIAAGYRPFATERVGTDSFDVLFVANSGTYARTNADWYSYYSPGNLATALTNNNQRITDLEVIDGGSGTTYMSATTVENTGPDAAGWGWLYNTTPAVINNWVNTANPPIRLIDLDTYFINGTRYYSAVGIQNTGAHARSWWYYYNVTPAQIASYCSANNAHLVNLEVHNGSAATPTFDVIMERNAGHSWWWYYGVTAAQAADLANLNGARMIDLDRYTDSNGNTRFAVVMLNNSNALSNQVRSVITSGLTNGEGGGYMKEVGGPVLAAIGDDHVFEPASMLKILYGAYAIQRCAAGADSINASVYVLDRCNNNECPNTVACDSGYETLSAAIAEMLEQSDNNRTKVVHDRYGRATLNAFADSLGMTRTHINHDIGCGSPANQLSLRDCGRLYEAIADGSLFNQSWQDTLYSLMIDERGNQGGFNTEINGQLTGLNLTSAELASFKSLAYRAVKGGSYTVTPPGGGAFVQHRTSGGWMRLPFKNAAGTIYYKEFVIQSFVNNESNATAAGNTNSAIWWTMARERIRAALQSWDDACNAPTVATQPRGRSVQDAATVTFSVTPAGTSPFTYQWYKGASAISNGPRPGGSTASGATSASFRLTNVSPTDEGQYRVLITNACGSVYSAYATLNVTCPADLDDGQGFGRPDGGVTVEDLLYFLVQFDNGSINGDLDDGSGSGEPDGGVTIEDLLFFLTRYSAGC